MSKPTTLWMRDSSPLMRSIALLVIITFSSVFYSPFVMAITDVGNHSNWWETPDNFNQFPDTLVELQDALSQLSSLMRNEKIKDNELFTMHQKTIEGKYRLLQNLDEIIRDEFSETEKLIKNKKLPHEVRAFHEAVVSRYDEQMELLMSRLEVIVKSNNPERIFAEADDALNQLKQFKHKRSHQALNSEQMPFGVSPNNAREPITDINQFNKVLSLIPNLTAKTSVRSIIVPVDTTVPIDEDLTETIDIQITTEIQALADSLGNDPIAIYNWVYNNIFFIPSYGSIQGSQLTMDNKKGNAFDTASLLISLLRASRIPARYKLGTIEVPIGEAQNWVGGVDNAQSVQTLLGQGGIPNVLVSSGGAVERVRLEHVWVEVYGPFGGAGNIQWVPVDPSFKQYTFTKGMNLKENVPYSGGAIIDIIQQSTATVNDDEGWASGLDSMALQARLDDYQNQLKSFIDSNNSNATVGDVVGTKVIIQSAISKFTDTLPYDDIVSSNAISELPVSLRHKFKYELTDQFGSLVLTFERSLPELAGKQLALSFSPATAADQTTLESIIPVNPAGPEDIPNRVSANLINLKAEFNVDGQVVVEQGVFGIGVELGVRLGLWDPRNNLWELTSNNLIAGEYQAVGVNLQGISHKQMESIRAAAEEAANKINSSEFENMTKHDYTGTLLQAGILSYMAINDVQDEILARTSNIATYRMPSYGTFSTLSSVEFFFGLPRNVIFNGVVMDVDRMISNSESKNNCWEDWVNFNLTSGQRLSALEHIIPETLFDTQGGVSAVKALAVAASEGQKIYTITSQNLSTVLPQLLVDVGVKNEVSSAVNSGKVVAISQSEINSNGWTGVGYIILDPESGTGAYKISGGINGGLLILLAGALLFLSGLLLLGPTIAAIGVGASLASLGLHTMLASLLFGFEGVNWGQVLDNFLFGAGLALLIISTPLIAASLAVTATWGWWAFTAVIWGAGAYRFLFSELFFIGRTVLYASLNLGYQIGNNRKDDYSVGQAIMRA